MSPLQRNPPPPTRTISENNGFNASCSYIKGLFLQSLFKITSLKVEVQYSDEFPDFSSYSSYSFHELKA